MKIATISIDNHERYCFVGKSWSTIFREVEQFFEEASGGTLKTDGEDLHLHTAKELQDLKIFEIKFHEDD